MWNFEDFYGQKTAREQLTLPLGVVGGTLEEYAPFSPEGGHLLVTGCVGCGKSTYLHTIIASILQGYTAEQVNLWLYDPKCSEFGVYARYAIPHLAGLWEQGEELTAALNEEIKRRIHLFSERCCKDYRQYAKEVGGLPQLVVVMDDATLLIQEQRRQWDRILHIAKACGIVLVFSDQDSRSFTLVDHSRVKRVIMRQTVGSVGARLGIAQMLKELARGEAIVDTPELHTVNLLYISADTCCKLLSQFPEA